LHPEAPCRPRFTAASEPPHVSGPCEQRRKVEPLLVVVRLGAHAVCENNEWIPPAVLESRGVWRSVKAREEDAAGVAGKYAHGSARRYWVCCRGKACLVVAKPEEYWRERGRLPADRTSNRIENSGQNRPDFRKKAQQKSHRKLSRRSMPACKSSPSSWRLVYHVHSFSEAVVYTGVRQFTS
jgi:hypothetical protein